MSKIEMEKLVAEIKEMETFKDEIAAEIEAKKDALKAEMTKQGKDEMVVGMFKVRYKQTKTKRFDGKRFQADHADLYEQYRTPSTYMRFTIS